MRKVFTLLWRCDLEVVFWFFNFLLESYNLSWLRKLFLLITLIKPSLVFWDWHIIWLFTHLKQSLFDLLSILPRTGYFLNWSLGNTLSWHSFNRLNQCVLTRNFLLERCSFVRKQSIENFSQLTHLQATFGIVVIDGDVLNCDILVDYWRLRYRCPRYFWRRWQIIHLRLAPSL